MRRLASARTDVAWLTGVLICAAVIGAVVAMADAASAVALVVVAAAVTPAVLKVAQPARRRDPVTLDGDLTDQVRGRQWWIPLWISLAWMLGTYAAFWTTGLSARVTNAATLNLFIAASTGAFALGFGLCFKRFAVALHVPVDTTDRVVNGRRLVLAGSIYLALFGILQMLEYGATGIGGVVARIQDPGSAYQSKFDVYALQQATGRVSAPMQVVTLAGVLYGVAGPLLVIYWRRLSLAFRIAGVAGLAVYALYFLFIGTQKGLGDIVVMVLTGALAGVCGTWWTRHQQPGSGRRHTKRYALLAALAFLAYMVSAQAQRAEQFGTQDVTPPSPIVAAVIGDRAATGVAATLFYPTHGYLGLSYNLGTPFEWARGFGSSPVVASYATQYFGARSPSTYPVRTQLRTGWPAGLYWATIYPWLASDLTFPGVVAFMLIFGWVFAKMWVEGAMKRDTLALVIFGQLAIAVAYIPANNQIGNSRPTAIGLATLFVFYLVRAARRTGGTPQPAALGRSQSARR